MDRLRLYQLLTLKVVSEFHDFCINNNLNYYAIAGTLLGSYRHSGFIPWDSDIDVGMLRPDYQKFIELFKHDLSDSLYLECDETEGCSKICFARLRLRGTSVVEKGNSNSINSGFYIDIFPLDYYPHSKPTTIDLLLFKPFKAFVRLKALKSGKVFSSTKLRTFIGFLILCFGFWIPKVFLVKKLNLWMTRFKNFKCAFVTNFNSKYGLQKQTMSFEIYGKPSQIKFDGLTLLAPSNSLFWLENIYGDWRKLPKIQKVELNQAYNYDFGNYSRFLSLTEEDFRNEFCL